MGRGLQPLGKSPAEAVMQRAFLQENEGVEHALAYTWRVYMLCLFLQVPLYLGISVGEGNGPE